MRRALAALAAALLVAGCSTDDGSEPDSGDHGGTGDTGEVVQVPGVVVDADSIALRPDARRFVVPCDGELCEWTTDGRYVGRFDGGGIVAVSGPGLYTDRVGDGVVDLVLLDEVSGKEIAAVEVYDVADAQDGPAQGLRDIAFSPDGKWVAAVGADGVVRRWTADGLADELTIEAGGDAVAAAFSPDGSLVAVASSDAPVTIHDATTGEQVGELDAPPQGAVEWSEDGWLATASFALDDAAATTIWDGDTHEVEATLDVPAYRLALADPGALLLTEKDAKDVLRWDWEDDDVVRYTGATDVPRAVLYSPQDARVIAVTPREGVLAWDGDGGRPTTFEKPED